MFKSSGAASQGDNGFVHSYLLQNTLPLLFNWHSVDVLTIPNKGKSWYLASQQPQGWKDSWLAGTGQNPSPQRGRRGRGGQGGPVVPFFSRIRARTWRAAFLFVLSEKQSSGEFFFSTLREFFFSSHLNENRTKA